MIAILLVPFSIVYRIAIFLWDIHWRNRSQVLLPVKVISVGGLTVGGSGKTSLTGFLASRFRSAGKNVAVVARGYKRTKNGALVAGGERGSDWEYVGDEPAALARSIRDLKVFVDSDKTYGAARAAEKGHDPLIIDDGFQHRKLKRDIDIVCLDGRSPFGNGMMLPSGRLREPVSALKRADIVVIIDPKTDSANMRAKIPPGIPVFEARKTVLAVRSLTGEIIQIGGARCLAFCGLGNPQSFRDSLLQTGCDIVEFMKFNDHHRYDLRDSARIIDRFQERGGEYIVTTLKDAVKLEKIWKYDYPLYYLEIVLRLEREHEFLSLMGL